ncbi:hypothetical protein Pint_05383 [Pistacia integerrima]|uniref:Uncharacterized protein n=1 Tax=Pistacia integerrima TaxID=434235 RepID=A0ACC0Z7S9_9ROSI|nr:hypothetical protein Pint_05383 [Pistacia integerrima]
MADAKQLHVAMFPWLAFGHMIPYFELAKRIAQKGHKVSFISTPRNIKRLPKIPPNLSSLMNFAWTLCFCGSSSSALINGEDPRTKPEDFTVPPQWVPFDTSVAYRLHEAKKFFDHYEMNDSGVKDMVRLGSVMAGCDVIAVKSCMEIESEWINLLGELHGKPVLPVGLLPPAAPDSRDGKEDKTWLTISEWLGKQKSGAGLIARVFAEKKAGIEIARNEEDGEYTRKSVAEALRLVIVEEEGGIYREKAKELRVLFADEELHDEYVKKFVEFLQNHK